MTGIFNQTVAINQTGGSVRIEGEGGAVTNPGIVYAGHTSGNAVAGTIRIKGNTNYNTGAVIATALVLGDLR